MFHFRLLIFLYFELAWLRFFIFIFKFIFILLVLLNKFIKIYSEAIFTFISYLLWDFKYVLILFVYLAATVFATIIGVIASLLFIKKLPFAYLSLIIFIRDLFFLGVG